MSEVRHRGFCTLCRSRCGAIFVTEDGRLKEVLPDPEHPTGGALCAKGRAAPEILADRDRLTRPLRRTRPKTEADPGWEPVEWEEALADIARRLSHIRDVYGPDAMLFTSTTPSGTAIGDSFEWIEAFVKAYGSANFVVAMEICNFQKDFGTTLTTGGSLGTPDYTNAEGIVLWGHNPARTWLAASSQISARAPGVPLTVIDPQNQGSGANADLWLGLRPGSDGALALGAIRHLLATGAYDHAFVRDWTDAALLVNTETNEKLTARAIGLETDGFVAVTAAGPVVVDTSLPPPAGFDPVLDFSGMVGGIGCASALHLLQQAADPWTIEATADATGIAESALAEFFALLSSNRSMAVAHWSGLSQSASSSQTVRAISCLFALRGDVDRIGSNRWFAGPPVRPFTGKPAGQSLGAERIPLGPPRFGYVTARDAVEAIETGIPYRPRGLFSFGTNLAASYPDWPRTAAALANLDLRVHCDTRLTPMAESADYVLPVTLPWEHASLRPGFELDAVSALHVQYRPAVVSPAGDQRPDYAIVRDLAQRLGFEDPLWHGSIEEAWDVRLAPSGLDLAALRGAPRGVTLSTGHPERGYATVAADGTVKGFNTPSRRVEFHSGLLSGVGEPALPIFAQPTTDPDFPLVLTTAKRGVYTQSSLRHVPSLARRAPAPEVSMCRRTADAAGLDVGDWCRISIATGSVSMKVRIDDALALGVLVGEHGWWQQADAGDALPGNTNLNTVVRNGADDPISGAPELRRLPCRIERDPALSQGNWNGKRAFVVQQRIDHPGEIVELIMAPQDAGHVRAFTPGQHVAFSLPGIELERHYSLVSPAQADAETMAVAIRRSGMGGLSDHVFPHVGVGDVVRLAAPAGRFRLPLHTSRPILMLAAGVGITPFLGYLRTLNAQRIPLPASITLVYATRDKAFDAEIASLDIPNFRYIPLESGRDLGPVLKDMDRGSRAFLCGSEGFMETAKAALLGLGFDAHAIQQEHFSARVPAVTGLGAARVTLAASGRSFTWSPGQQSILAAADAAGMGLPAGCRAGECESCAIRLIAGSVHHARDVDDDACLTCCAVPIGDVVLDA